MSLNVVELVDGKARVNWLGAVALFAGLFAACGLIPSGALWLWLGDVKVAGSALAIGFSMACCSLPMLIAQQLRLPAERLPLGK